MLPQIWSNLGSKLPEGRNIKQLMENWDLLGLLRLQNDDQGCIIRNEPGMFSLNQLNGFLFLPVLFSSSFYVHPSMEKNCNHLCLCVSLDYKCCVNDFV